MKKAVILVAGLGSRLKPLTNTMPKCLTQVHGTSILSNMLEALSFCGIDESILVLGHLGHKIQEAIGDKFQGMKISYVENRSYQTTSPVYSLWLALKDLTVPDCLLVLEGDVFFVKELLQKSLASNFPNLTVVEPYNESLEGTFVTVNDNKKVVDCIGLKERPKDYNLDDKYKTVNIHKFERDFVANVLIPHLKASVDKTEGQESFESFMRTLCHNSHAPLKAIEAEGLKWFEIDDEKDLRVAEEIFS